MQVSLWFYFYEWKKKKKSSNFIFRKKPSFKPFFPNLIFPIIFFYFNFFFILKFFFIFFSFINNFNNNHLLHASKFCGFIFTSEYTHTISRWSKNYNFFLVFFFDLLFLFICPDYYQTPFNLRAWVFLLFIHAYIQYTNTTSLKTILLYRKNNILFCCCFIVKLGVYLGNNTLYMKHFIFNFFFCFVSSFLVMLLS